MKITQLKRRAILAAAVGLTIASQCSFATTVTWDPGLTKNSSSGGGGTWTTTTANWYNGSTDVIWPDTSADEAIFANVAGVVVLGSNVTANELDFTHTGYTLSEASGGTDTITMAGTTPTINYGTGDTDNINVILAGSSGLTVTGVTTGGTHLTLNDASNSFTGGLTISGAQVNFGANGDLGAASGGVTLQNGGILDYTASTVITETRTFTFGTGGGTLDVSTQGYLGGKIVFDTTNQITGSGNITITGTGYLSLYSNSNAVGNWIISGSTVEDGAGGGDALGSGSVTVNAGGELSSNNTAGVSNNITLNGGTLGADYYDDPSTTNGVFKGTITANASTTSILQLGNFYGADGDGNTYYNMTISGSLTGSGNLNIIDGVIADESGQLSSTGPNGQLLSLTGNNTGYTGTLTVDGGHGVQFGATNTGTSSTSILTHVVANALDATDDIDDALPLIAIGYNGAAPTITDDTSTYGGVFAYAGTSTQNLNLATLFNGNWYLGADTNGDTYSGTSLTPNTISGSPVYRLGGGGGTLNLINAVLTGGTTSVDIGAPMINGGGTVVYDAAMTYGGPTIIANGTLQAGIANAVPSTSVLTLGSENQSNFTQYGATFDLHGFNDTVAGLAVDPNADPTTTFITNNSTTANAVLTVNTTPGSTYFTGIIENGASKTLGLIVQGTVPTNALTLEGTNTFTGGVTVQSSTLATDTINNISTAGPLGDNTSVTLGSSGTNGILEDTAAFNQTSTMPFVLATSGTGTFQIENAGDLLTLSGLISGSGGLFVTGPGILNPTYTNTFNGGLTISSGIVQVAAVNNVSTSGVLGSNTKVTLGASGSITGTLDYTAGNTSSNMPFVLAAGGTGAFQIATSTTTLTLSGNISGSGTLDKTGPGTLDISGTNSYGGTLVGSGTLQLGSSFAFPAATPLALGDSIGDSGILDLDGHNATVSSLAVTAGAGTANTIGNSSASAASTLTFASGTSSFSGVIANVLGSGTQSTALTVSSGSLTLTGTNTYAGLTTINNGGTLKIGATGALPSGNSVTDNGNLQINANSTAGTISGTGTTTVAASTTLGVGAFAQTSLVNNGTTTITGAGTVDSVTGSTGNLVVGNGSSNNTVQLVNSTPLGVQSSQASVSVTTGSTLDITNNSVILNTGTPNPSLTTYQTLASNGYNNGNWNGTTSITSSWVATQDAGSGPRYGVAVVESANDYVANLTSSQIEITPALLGDTNVDGVVDFTDYLTVSTDFGKTGQDWEEGNFDYSPTGTVDFTDYLDVATNFGDDSSLSASDLASMESFANENGYTLIANADNVGFQVVAVPEPATAGLMLLAGAALLGKRRRRRVC